MAITSKIMVSASVLQPRFVELAVSYAVGEIDHKSYEHPALGITRPFEGIEFELLEGDKEIMNGVRVFMTPGHSPGHQAVRHAPAGGAVASSL